MESSTNPIKSQIYTLENSLLRTSDQIVMEADVECPGFAVESLAPGSKDINVELNLKEAIGNEKEAIDEFSDCTNYMTRFPWM